MGTGHSRAGGGGTLLAIAIMLLAVAAAFVPIPSSKGEGGSLRVLEAWDPGWNASEEGGQLPVAMADDTWLAVPLGPGSHKIRLTYVTPGATAGTCMSLLGVMLLTALSMGAPPLSNMAQMRYMN
jgi:hypothetical protein